jgi:integrase/recombinase XerD
MKQAKLLTDAEFKRFSAIVTALGYQTGNHILVALRFYSGLRAREIAALEVGNVFDEASRVKETIYLNSDQAKGSDSATVLVNSKLKRQLAKFSLNALPQRGV